MTLNQCEVRELFIRGVSAYVIFGRESINEETGLTLLGQFLAVYPSAERVAYLSRDGWQMLSGGYVAPEGALSRRFTFDDVADVATIDGVRFAGAVVDAFTKPTPDGEWFRVVSTDNGVSVIERHQEPKKPAADAKSKGAKP